MRWTTTNEDRGTLITLHKNSATDHKSDLMKKGLLEKQVLNLCKIWFADNVANQTIQRHVLTAYVLISCTRL